METTEYPTFTLANGTVLELGPHFTDCKQIKWKEIEPELARFNTTLPKDEKPWRTLTDKEYDEIGAKVREIWKGPSFSDTQKASKARKYLRKNGWRKNFYWSSTEYTNNQRFAWGWNSYFGSADYYLKRYEFLVRLVRERTPQTS